MKTPDTDNIEIAIGYLEQARDYILKIRRQSECSEPFARQLELIAARIDSAQDVLENGY